MRCNYCKVEMRPAAYTDNSIYEASEIYDISEGKNVENRRYIGKIYYCPHCGNLQVNIRETFQ